MQVYADVLGRSIEVHPPQQAPTVGASVLGMFAAGCEKAGFDSVQIAAKSMSSAPGAESAWLQPNLDHHSTYEVAYDHHRALAVLLQSAP